ncbi:Pro-neuregulin-3, membrane-bound isoform [Collichthys lucidus]|uniref:Pro-neuregulin-3, membrane-bound isoform n=1 Tax=Collichthys lucidus TaxID=240159 RepID=A0A4V6AVI1_COLLU|nr:Pro-neuregulin-3, membrane-bound isoform [Collichthys lucidus]
MPTRRCRFTIGCKMNERVRKLQLLRGCKEGYHGLRCDQFVPKTDAILSDPTGLEQDIKYVDLFSELNIPYSSWMTQHASFTSAEETDKEAEAVVHTQKLGDKMKKRLHTGYSSYTAVNSAFVNEVTRAIPVDGICIRAVMTSSAQDVTVEGDLERKRVAVATGNHGEKA